MTSLGGAVGVTTRRTEDDGHCLGHQLPTIGHGVFVQRRAGLRGEFGGELFGEPAAGLGRLTRDLEGAHEAALLDRGGELLDPVLLHGLDAGVERFAQLRGQQTGLVVARAAVGLGHDGAQVAQRDLVGAADRGFGEVAPFGGGDLGEQIVGQGEDRGLIDGILAFGLRRACSGRRAPGARR